VSVVGLRLGALLAVEAVGPGECANLVLWAPVVSGKSYVRQLQATEQMAELQGRPADAAAGDIEAAGFLLSAETAKELRNAKLDETSPGGSTVLVVGACDKARIDRLAEAGTVTTTISPPGYAEMMAEPHFSRVPREAVRELSAWLAERILTDSPAKLRLDFASPADDRAEIAWRSTAEPVAVRNELKERLLRIRAGRLFGILCEPVDDASDRPMIVLLNAGSSNHVGPGRIGVEFSRDLAGCGFRVLRLDILGLGESIADDAACENVTYPATAFGDIAETLAFAQEKLGARRFVLLGLCSGAYFAFQSAAQLPNPAIVESVLLNPLTFHWDDSMLFDLAAVQSALDEHFYMARAKSLPKLWKFLKGDTKIGYWAAIELVARRAVHWLRQKFSPRCGEELGFPVQPGHPVENRLPADLRRISAAGRRLALFVAEGDPGLTIMNFHAPGEAKRLRRSGELFVEMIPQSDHTFSRRVSRRAVIAAVAEYLCSRYPRQS
jgi:pimeloyl-ACP methyl ester carboxylesterase